MRLNPLGSVCWTYVANKREDIHRFLFHPLGAVGAIMGGYPLAIVAINTPDRDRRAHPICGHIARHPVRLRGHGTLLHVRHQTLGILPETGIHQRLNRLGLERLAQHGQEVPLPFPTQEIVGSILQRRPVRSLGIIASTGGQHMQRGVITTTVTIP
jgi:hypothetical protein